METTPKVDDTVGCVNALNTALEDSLLQELLLREFSLLAREEVFIPARIEDEDAYAATVVDRLLASEDLRNTLRSLVDRGINRLR